MLALFRIPCAALSEIRSSSGLSDHARGFDSTPDDVPVMSMIGDSHTTLFDHTLDEMGYVRTTYDIGSSMIAPVRSAQCDIDTLATTIA